MRVLLAILTPLRKLNDIVLGLGKGLAVVALALMVIVILAQVFFRYVLNNALPWPDEAARFLMLWMTGLIAPAAYRAGGFVAIDMALEALPRRAADLLALVLLLISLAVLAVALQLGLRHVNSGWLFNSSSLKLPLDLIGGETLRIKLAWMYLSVYVGAALLTLVNLELILRQIISLMGGGDRLPPLDGMNLAEAE
jgi:TRAP-type C4-dicarboxylate transport system permease small subunit